MRNNLNRCCEDANVTGAGVNPRHKKVNTIGGGLKRPGSVAYILSAVVDYTFRVKHFNAGIKSHKCFRLFTIKSNYSSCILGNFSFFHHGDVVEWIDCCRGTHC